MYDLLLLGRRESHRNVILACEGGFCDLVSYGLKVRLVSFLVIRHSEEIGGKDRMKE